MMTDEEKTWSIRALNTTCRSRNWKIDRHMCDITGNTCEFESCPRKNTTDGIGYGSSNTKFHLDKG